MLCLLWHRLDIGVMAALCPHTAQWKGSLLMVFGIGNNFPLIIFKIFTLNVLWTIRPGSLFTWTFPQRECKHHWVFTPFSPLKQTLSSLDQDFALVKEEQDFWCLFFQYMCIVKQLLCLSVTSYARTYSNSSFLSYRHVTTVLVQR